MRIYVREQEGKKINIAIPTGMVLNRLTAFAAKKCIAKYDKSDNVNISAADINRLFYEIKKFKRKHPGLPLVEVESKNGDRVYIKL
jgi:hypothetical protein